MPDAPARVRIAPSPTGEPHIGTAYITLFNHLLAKKLGGVMVLRIEDTDQVRSTAEAEAKLIEALHWFGLPWAEGPDKGGDYGPYRQSERKELYKPYVDELLEKGHAFKCFCSTERLEEMREAQRAANLPVKYDNHCLGLSAEEVAKREAAGEAFVVRMKIPEEGACVFQDGIYGEVSIPWETVDAQVILKSDGMPTYHLANVVDDHLMKITHVARGEEWVSSVPKHVLLYEYFGWTPPEFMHLPLMRAMDRKKLSKRRNPTSLSYFQRCGYLPEALVNFLGLFFITLAEGDEVMDLDQLVERFDPNGVALGGAAFDMQKLNAVNSRWIREKLSPEQFREAVISWALESGRLDKTLELAQSRLTTLGDLPDLAGFVFKGDLALDRAAFDATKNGAEDSLVILKAVQEIIDAPEDWTAEAIEQALRDLAERMERKLRVLTPPLFIAVSGSSRSLPLFDSMALLGRSIVRQRINQAVAMLSQPAEIAPAQPDPKKNEPKKKKG